MPLPFLCLLLLRAIGISFLWSFLGWGGIEYFCLFLVNKELVHVATFNLFEMVVCDFKKCVTILCLII